jgi:hypothetical protein
MKTYLKTGLLFTAMVSLLFASCQKDPEVISVLGITVEPATAIVRVGSTSQLQGSITPFDATDKTIMWLSRDATKATVSTSGVVTAVAIGKTWIVAKTNDGAYKDSCEVTIDPAAGSTITLSGNITSNITLKSDVNYVLDGWVYVKEGAIFTIEPGTIIKGKIDTKAALIIERGAKIMAEGTAQKPIVFTSAKAAGSRARGDWGGIILCGKATINVNGGVAEIEGGVGTQYGGAAAPVDTDNSGVLKYVRIEFGGYAFQPDKEINGLTMGGVGSGTTIDYVQVSYSNDDSFEWFGGTVNCKHLIAFRGMDDEFDTDYGFKGFVQYVVGLRDPAVADISKSNGFESDNDGTGSSNTPTTNPRFGNVSLYGPKATVTTTSDALFQTSMHLRRKTNLEVYNSVFAGWPVGVKIDDSKGAAGTGAMVKGSIISGMVTNYATTDAETFYTAAANANRVVVDNADLKVSAPFNLTAPNFLPQTGSPLLTGAVAVPTGLETTDYIGAFKTTDWTATWANWTPVQTTY